MGEGIARIFQQNVFRDFDRLCKDDIPISGCVEIDGTLLKMIEPGVSAEGCMV